MDTPKYGTPEWDQYVADERATLESQVGQVWDTDELQADYTVHSFLAPFVAVTRKADNLTGLLQFQHSPRFYFDFTVRRL